MRNWIPVPGSAKARLIEAAVFHFERAGFEGVNVSDLAAKAGVTTGALYHHFGSKLGLYTVVRDDFETRITDRMEGAAASIDGSGRPAVRAALLVAFAAAVKFGVCRLLGERTPANQPDPVEETLRSMLPQGPGVAAVMLAAVWRAALLSVADGTTSGTARGALEFILEE